jgi:phospholipid/cholesterol/gamma-HCH transport system permease protein
VSVLETPERPTGPRRRERELDPLVGVGRWAKFVWDGVIAIKRLGPMSGEVLRQAAILVTGSTLVIVTMTAMIGGSCGIESTFLARTVGAGIIAPLFIGMCTVREVVPLMFGVILAGKIGCGFVAEIGAMRINEEVDAMDVMGIPSLAFIVSTRIVAAAFVLPWIYLSSIASAQGAAWIASLVRFGDISAGTWALGFYLGFHPIDLAYTMVKGAMLTIPVLATGLYYGYTVRGGPVEVGEAVARSMRVNLILVALINSIASLILWGWKPPLPIA